jgi:hypothetical protein
VFKVPNSARKKPLNPRLKSQRTSPSEESSDVVRKAANTPSHWPPLSGQANRGLLSRVRHSHWKGPKHPTGVLSLPGQSRAQRWARSTRLSLRQVTVTPGSFNSLRKAKIGIGGRLTQNARGAPSSNWLCADGSDEAGKIASKKVLSVFVYRLEDSIELCLFTLVTLSRLRRPDNRKSRDLPNQLQEWSIFCVGVKG